MSSDFVSAISCSVRPLWFIRAFAKRKTGLLVFFLTVVIFASSRHEAVAIRADLLVHSVKLYAWETYVAEETEHIACSRAEQLYEAASSDARILERAIFVSNFRREVERALGRHFSDQELRTLADQARAEAHRWYKYVQEPGRGCATGPRG